MKYCCHVWVGAPASCYLKLLDKLQKWICRTVGPAVAASIFESCFTKLAFNIVDYYKFLTNTAMY